MNYFLYIVENLCSMSLFSPLNIKTETKSIDDYNSLMIFVEVAHDCTINWKNVEILAQKDFILIKYDNYKKTISIPENYSFSDTSAKLIDNKIVIRIPSYVESKLIIVEGLNKHFKPVTLIMTSNPDIVEKKQQ